MGRSGKVDKSKAQQAKPEGKKVSPPTSVWIGPFEYSISYGPIGEGKDWGRVVYGEHLIQIDNSGPGPRTAVVLMHEIFHAILNENDLVNCDEKVDERIVNTMSMVFAKVLMDNPKVREYIIQGLADYGKE